MACQSSDTSLNESTDDNLSFLDMELEALQSIFLNELEVKEDENFTTVSIDLYPSTADKLDEQYVRMTLQFILNEEYPDEIPKINIRNPRGLSDEELNSITQDLLAIAESKQGSSMLFEMIDAAREHLTVGNRPSGECAICLHGFSDNDAFTKTECYHYFHSHCLARYAKNFFENPRNSEDDAENKVKSDELLCPMCRIPIEFDEWNVDYPPPEESDESNFTLSEEIIELQKKMAALFQKQVQQGGIIDVEAEKNKYLLEISNVSVRSDSEEKSELKSAAEGDSVIESKNEQSDEIDSPAHDRKDYVKDRSRNFDHRGKNRNFRPIDNRSNNRYGQRYVKQSFNHGNYNKYRYGKQSSENSYQDESEIPQNFETKDSLIPQDVAESEGFINSSSDMVEPNDASEMQENASPSSKAKHNPNFSPRYKNRGYYHGRNNYNYDGRRSGRGSYNEQRNSQPSHRYSAQRTEDSSSKFEKDLRTHDHDNYKPDYRSGSYRHDNGYYGKQRYNDSRNNSYHGFKGAYSGRDAYSNSYNSRGNRYTDSKDRDQYAERNYRENRYTASKDRDQYPDRNYRENKYTDSKDRDQHSERNYRENRYADCKDRDQYAERNYRENRYTPKDRDQNSERNYKENRYADSKDRDQNPERNYKENRYADSKDRDQNPERNYKENRYADSKDRDQNPERNYKENRYADSKDRDQNPERNYKENRYADSKDRDQNPERNYKENRYADTKDRDQNPERNYKENRYADSKDRDQNPERNYKENRYADSKDRDQNPERNYKENRHADTKDRDQNPERNYKENRYVDSKDRAQYPAKNFREKRTYRDGKYKNSEDNAYNKSRQGTRNYSGSRPERYSDRLYAEPSNVKSESLELNNQNQNGETLTAENSSTNLPSNSSQGEKSLPKKDLTDFEEKSSNVVSAFNSSSSNNLPNAFCENADVAPRTVNPPPGFANPLKKVVYGLQGANPPPGFNRS